MTLLSYSHNLVAGTPENINDVMDNLNDVKALLNGNLDTANLAASAKPSTLMGAYRTVAEATSHIPGGLGAGTYFELDAGFLGLSGSGYSASPIYAAVTPADFAVAGLTTQFRIRVVTTVNATAPGVNFTYGLYPISSIAGGSTLLSTTVGAAVAGSTVTRSTPGAGSASLDASSDFTIAAPGAYVLGVSPSGASNGSSYSGFTIQLQVRNV